MVSGADVEMMSQQAPKKKTKTQETVPIPADLMAFLKEVHLLILDEADAAVRQSDDLLQCQCAFGGLVSQDSSQYGFTYYSAMDEEQDVEEPTTWELLLDKSEIESIATGGQEQLTLWACQVDGCGNKFSDAARRCDVHDYADIAA